MPLLEFDEFSSPEKLIAFVKSGDALSFFAKNTDENPLVSEHEDIGETHYIFSNYAFEYVENEILQPTIFLFMRKTFDSYVHLFNFIKNDTNIEKIIEKFGEPDFSRGGLEPLLLDTLDPMIKYYYDEYSISFEYDNQSIIRVSVFEDEYR